ncbi:MAG: hypothetical protein V2B17_06010, partial [Chloroflexota bacterium]
GIAVASIISGTFVLAALAVLAWRHRPGARATGAEAGDPMVAAPDALSAETGPDVAGADAPPNGPPPEAASRE